MSIISLGTGFSRLLLDLEKSIKVWASGGVAAMQKNYRVIGQLVMGQAIRRVPVRSNRLKQGIITVTFMEGKLIVTEVGTNVRSDTGFPYPTVLEFGSKHIAGGAVKSLGDSPDITDAEAITDWPALRERGGTAQQMPWLRPAWKSVEPQAISLINVSFEPPSQRRR